ncbi:MAG: SdrD B-like domain-containing protein [bacterium]|nr:SdrD B-like domain-containing protein [bacterium]
MPYALPRVNRRVRVLTVMPLALLFIALGLGLDTPTTGATVSTTKLTDSSGSALTTFSIGGNIYVTVTDANKNTDSTTKQKINATLSTATAGDSELLDQAATQLEETGVNTGVFRNPGYPTALKDATVTANDGVLEIDTNDTITATYTDSTSESVTFDFDDSPLEHSASEAAHVDDGSGADDPAAGSCGDAEAYTGTEGDFDPNVSTNGGFIPVDSTDWDIQPDSTASNGGPTVSNIATDNDTRERNESIKDSVLCHGWSIHEFLFDIGPFTSLNTTSLDIDWAGSSTYAGPETQAMNDAFLLVLNRTGNTWEVLDSEANIAVTDAGAISDVPLTGTIATNLSNYIDSGSILRLLVVGYDRAVDSAGGSLFTDYISVQATGQDVSSDALEIGGGSIFGTVYNDKDRDGVMDSGESGISGVSVTLQDGAGGALVTDTTDSNGDYGFIGFPADTYRLHETDPSGYTSTTPNDLGPLTLSAGQVIADQDFGDAQSLSTTGLKSSYVWMTFAGVVALGVLVWFGSARLLLKPARSKKLY